MLFRVHLDTFGYLYKQTKLTSGHKVKMRPMLTFKSMCFQEMAEEGITVTKPTVSASPPVSLFTTNLKLAHLGIISV